MHTYHPRWDADHPSVPDIESFRFHGALDVVAYAELDAAMGWKTWPDVWHLDRHGLFRCSSQGSSLDSIRWWADNPTDLLRARAEGLATSGCAPRWLILETRRSWMREMRVDEIDAWAFVQVQRSLAPAGVDLVDCMIFDDQLHWWSLHELTTGTTRW